MFTRAFCIQYISLLLMILTMVIGSSGTGTPGEPRKPVIQTVMANPELVTKLAPVGQLDLENLFDLAGNLNTETINSIAYLLQNHDIDCELEVYFANAKGTRSDLPSVDQALARSMGIFNYLISQKIPPSALRIIASPVSESAAQGRVQFFVARS